MVHPRIALILSSAILALPQGPPQGQEEIGNLLKGLLSGAFNPNDPVGFTAPQTAPQTAEVTTEQVNTIRADTTPANPPTTTNINIKNEVLVKGGCQYDRCDDPYNYDDRYYPDNIYDDYFEEDYDEER